MEWIDEWDEVCRLESMKILKVVIIIWMLLNTNLWQIVRKFCRSIIPVVTYPVNFV